MHKSPLRRPLSRGVLLSGVALGVLFCGTASFAEPSITYTGSVAPPPPTGTTNWDFSTALFVGYNGDGTLDIRDGATATGGSVEIGYGNGFPSFLVASITVDGKGSALWGGGAMNVGDGTDNNATLTISNGGYVDVASGGGNNVKVGGGTGSTGRVIVTGESSAFNVHDNILILGSEGDGDLTIANGGQVTGYQLYLGNRQRGRGAATIFGQDSAWNGQSGVWVGQFSRGQLDIYDGGSINDNSLQIAYDKGTTGVVNVGGEAGQTARNAGNLNVDKIVFNKNGGGSTGTLNFNTFDGLTVRGDISSSGAGSATINQIAGTTVFTGDNSGFSGTTNVTGGALQLGNGSALGGTLNVAAGGMFGGDGEVQGNTSFANGSSLYGQSGGKLVFDHDLTLPGNNQVNVVLNGGPSNEALFNVQGDLNLGNSQLNIEQGSTIDVGVYRIFDYSGSKTGILTIGNVSEGDASDYAIQDNIDHQINLVSQFGRTFFFWDGSQTSGDGTIHGGDGTWDGTTTNWTGIDGQINTKWSGNGFGVFGGDKGTVNIDPSFTPSVNGMQFMTDGYVLQGGRFTLGGKDNPLIMVGDGKIDDADKTALINSVIQGTDGLVKTGLGTLVLTGTNSYTGGTAINQGTLQLGDGGDSGSILGDVVVKRDSYSRGTLAFNRSDIYNFTGAISGGGNVVQRGSGTTVFSGDNTFTGGLTVEKGTAKAGIVDHAFGSGLLTVQKDGTADLAGFNETVGGLAGAGHVALGSGRLTLDQDIDTTFSGMMDGPGGLTKNGNGTLTLSGTGSYAGQTNVNGGALVQGAAGAFSGASTYSLANNALISLGGYDTSMVGLSNSGTVDFGGSGGTTLTVAGNYAGNGGTLVINSVLNGDDSKTDMLKVGGDTSGNTHLKVINRGGLGAQTVNGIQLVDVQGQSNGTFSLLGDFVTKDGKQAVSGGAYAYTLQQGSGTGNKDGNWYLTSQRYSPSIPVYEGYLQNMQALNKLPTLQERVGERYWTGRNGDGQASGAAVDDKGVWARIEGAHNRLEPDTSLSRMKQDINTFIMQAGVDGQFYESDSGKLIAGITGQYGHAKGDVSSFHGDGAISTDGWSLGATATWYGNSGFYVDGQAQVTWFDCGFR